MVSAGNNQSAEGVGYLSEPVKRREIESWLLEHETLAEAERLARLDEDRQLVEELRNAGFEGTHWNYYATELVKYGLAVLTAWIVRGVIFEKAKRQSFGGVLPPPDESLREYDTAQSLAGEVVAVAIKTFREKVLLPGVWDPAKGASIKTFFVGQCMKQFPNVYKRWRNETFGDPVYGAFGSDSSDEYTFGLAEDVAIGASSRVEAGRALAKIENPRSKQVFVLFASGFSTRQIAVRLDLTVKTVEQIIYNERRKVVKGSTV